MDFEYLNLATNLNIDLAMNCALLQLFTACSIRHHRNSFVVSVYGQ